MRNENLIILCLALALLYGVASLVGIPPLPYQLVIDLFVSVLFLFALDSREGGIKSPGIWIFIPLTFIVFLSTIVNGSDYFTAYRMFRNILIPYLFFLAVVNFPLSEDSFKKINAFLFIMLFGQIVASVLKYLAWGVREGGIIGTFGVNQGALSTIFPILAIIFLLSFYLIYEKKNIYLFFMAGFALMAWGGGKRAFIFILPLFILFTYVLYKKYEYDENIITIKNTVRAALIIIVLLPVLYMMIIYTPTLNPERQYGGSFDIRHVIEYAKSYQTGEHYHYDRDRYGDRTVMSGRMATMKHAYSLISTNTQKLLFGFGPSSIYATPRGDENLVRFGVVEFQTGFARYIMLVGIPGALLLLLLYVRLTLLCMKQYYDFNNYWRAIILGVFISMFVLLYDYFLYSRAFLDGLIPSMLFFYLAGAIINKQNNNENEEEASL